MPCWLSRNKREALSRRLRYLQSQQKESICNSFSLAEMSALEFVLGHFEETREDKSC